MFSRVHTNTHTHMHARTDGWTDAHSVDMCKEKFMDKKKKDMCIDIHSDKGGRCIWTRA